MLWRAALWAVLGAALLVMLGYCTLARAVTIACFPVPPGDLPAHADRYETGLADRLLSALSNGGKFPLDASAVVAWPRPGGMVAVIILRGAYGCPLLVPHGDYEAARRKTLGTAL